MVRSNRIIIYEFLDTIDKKVAGSSSDKYVLMVLNKFVKNHKKEFSFLKYVHIDLRKIKIDKKIDSVDPEVVGEFLKLLINSMFSHLFMLLVKRKLPKSLARDLEELGVIINGS